MLNMQELVQVFLAEGRELTDFIEQNLLQIEQGGHAADAEQINALFRAAHTIKGSAGVVGLSDVVSFTHLVETAFEQVRSGEMALDPALISVLLKCNDHINALFDYAEKQTPVPSSSITEGKALLDQLETVMKGRLSAEEQTIRKGKGVFFVEAKFAANTFRDGFDPFSVVRYLHQHYFVEKELWQLDHIPALLDIENPDDIESCYLGLSLSLQGESGEKLVEAFEYLQADSDIVINEVSSRSETEEAVADTEKTPELNASKQPTKDMRMMRVHAFRLDEMVNQLGELVIATAALESLTHGLNNSALNESVEHIQHLVDELQGNALQLRMVQIGDTFNRFARVVRDLSSELGKDIKLLIEGAETELDKSMVERISDPLMHLVRNAIDHGLEFPDERRQNGKSEEGLLKLSAYHDSGSIVIEIKDDGRGINRKKVLAKAQEKGLISKQLELSEHDIDELIFAPGFSTADEVSNLSGRGVGMDVVRKNIEALRGTVNIQSIPGQGTCFQLRLPLTLAIIDGFMVRVADSKFVIPLNLVTECIELPEQQIPHKQASFMNLRDEMLPFIFLDRVFQLRSEQTTRRSIIVVQYAQHRAGLVVDQVIGEFQTVIKPLGKLFEYMQGISGSSILGSGDIALILDIPKLIATQTDKQPMSHRKAEVVL